MKLMQSLQTDQETEKFMLWDGLLNRFKCPTVVA